jgi:myo-inositol catabolism protein IolH
MVSSVFAEDETAHDVSRYQLATMTNYVSKHRNG